MGGAWAKAYEWESKGVGYNPEALGPCLGREHLIALLQIAPNILDEQAMNMAYTPSC